MTDLNDSNNNAPDPGSDASSPQEREKVSIGRRRLAASAPLLLTLANRPAMANYCSISGAHSGNMSGNKQNECFGDLPSEWAGNVPDEWKEVVVNTYYLEQTGQKPASDDNMTFDDVLPPDVDDRNVLANIVAAELNIYQYGDMYGIDQFTLHQWVGENNPCLVDLCLLNGLSD